jgi:hypothetical protein
MGLPACKASVIASSLWIFSLTSAPTAALAFFDDALQVHGFAMQAGIHTSDNSFGGDSDDAVSSDYNEAGLNVSAEFFQRLRLSVQMVAHNAGDYDTGALRTDYAQIDFAAISNVSDKAGIRVGRVKNAYGLFNDTRDVAHTRPSIYLPPIIYWEQLRDIMLYRDGGAIYWDNSGDHGTFSFDAGVGKPQITERMATETLFFQVDHIDADDPRVVVARLLWEDAGGNLRLALSTLQAESGVDVGFEGDFKARLYLASLQYSTEKWQLTSEAAFFNYDLSLNDPFLSAFSRNTYGDAIYVQYAWFFTPDWQVYARYDIGYFDRHDRDGDSFETLMIPAAAAFSRDAGIGTRWDIDENWMLSFEAHYIEGMLALSIVDNPALREGSPYWTLVAAELAFRF